MKILFILLMAITSSAYANFHLFTGEEISKYKIRSFVLTTQMRAEIYAQYDYSCSKGKTVYLIEVTKNEKKIVLKAGCNRNQVLKTFINDALFTVIDSPNILECKLNSDCYVDINGSEQCSHNYGSQTRTEFLYVSVDENNIVTSYNNRFKVTECR